MTLLSWHHGCGAAIIGNVAACVCSSKSGQRVSSPHFPPARTATGAGNRQVHRTPRSAQTRCLGNPGRTAISCALSPQARSGIATSILTVYLVTRPTETRFVHILCGCAHTVTRCKVVHAHTKCPFFTTTLSSAFVDPLLPSCAEYYNRHDGRQDDCNAGL